MAARTPFTVPYNIMSTSRVGKVKYYIDKVIGRGSFGTVFSGSFREDMLFGRDIKPIAIKRVERGRVDESLIQREVELMQKANGHPYILRYFCTETDANFLFIATEMCIGTLEEYVTNSETYKGPRFKSEREMLYQVTQGLAYLHSLDIVHRDIKPTNILIFSNATQKEIPDSGSDSCDSSEDETPVKVQMKLADFGISKILQTNKEDFTNTSVANPSGTKGWMAPEVYECNRFDFKVDVWALGCIFGYTLSGGKHPFGDDVKRIVRIIQKENMSLAQKDLKRPYSEDDVSFELIKSLLQIEPRNRPTAEDVLKSPFFIVVHSCTALPIEFLQQKLITKEFTDLCNSFRTSVTDEGVDQFKGFVNDERIDVNVQTAEDGMKPLHILCEYFSDHPSLVELVQLLILKGATINAKTPIFDDSGWYTPLHCLGKNGKLSDESMLAFVKFLIQNGAKVNTRDKNGETPLHKFCTRYEYDNMVDIVQLLIKNGADVNAKNRNGVIPLHNLVKCYRKVQLIDTVRLLIEHGADVNAKAMFIDGTPLLFLCMDQTENDNLIDVIRLLIEKGADANFRRNDGYTPLHALCEFYEKYELLMDIVHLMVEEGADLNDDGFSEGTPLQMLRKRGFSV